MKKQVDSPPKTNKLFSFSNSNIEPLPAAKFFKLKKMNSYGKNFEDSPSTTNPEKFLQSCEKLTDEELEERYRLNPMFRSRMDIFLESKEAKLKKFRKNSDEIEQKIEENEGEMTSKLIIRQDGERVNNFYTRCARLFKIKQI